MINEGFFLDDYATAQRVSMLLKENILSANPRVEETNFVQYWLPRFMADENSALKRMFNQEWLNVAGSYFSEVDIYRGETYIDTIPSLFVPYPTMTHQQDKLDPSDSLVGAIREVEKFNANYSVNSHRRLANVLFDKVGPQDNISDEIKRIKVKRVIDWDRIITRYGYPSILTPEEKRSLSQLETDSKNETTLVESPIEEIYEFDDA